MSRMFRQRIQDTYSVFVGHIHPDVTKREIVELFKVCGELVEVVILVNPESAYNFGFVRYGEPEAAFRAVHELSRWILKGCELVVDISKDTARKLKTEKENAEQKVPETQGRRERNQEGSVNPSMFLQDTMYLNRLRENCSSLHMKASDGTGKVSADFLFDDIGQADLTRFPTVWGSLSDPSVNFRVVSQKIMQRCRLSAEVDPSFGEKKAVEFLSSLETIMKEIGSVLGARYEKSAVENGVDTEDVEDRDQKIDEDDLAVKQCLDEIRNENGNSHGDGATIVECKSESDLESTCLSEHCESRRMSPCESNRCCQLSRAGVQQSKLCDIRNESIMEDDDKSENGANFRDCFTSKTNEKECFLDNKEVIEKHCKESVVGEIRGPSGGKVCVCLPQVDNNCGVVDINRRSDESAIAIQEELDLNDFTGEAGVGLKGAVDNLDTSKDESVEDQLDTGKGFWDPAILDYHLSKLNENNSKPQTVLDKLFANIAISEEKSKSNCVQSEMVRSVSRDSSVSSGSNEGCVDDSGVESDFFSLQKVGNDLEDRELAGERTRGLNHGRPGRRSFPETIVRQSNTSKNYFDLESYVSSMGRGRGVKSGIDKLTKAPVGRGVFSLK